MRPLPALTPENTAFWTGGEAGKLMICFCNACDHAIHPPQLVCPACLSLDVEARAVPGTGTIYSHTLNHQQWHPDMVVPFSLAVVDVDGAPGVRLTAEVTGVDPATVAIDQRVAVEFLNIEDIWFPQWRPTGGENGQ